ncbi:hypothetical protein OAA67_04035 [Winogradskyella sp.]|nr:hypothetical protein [Winogradskyella sp.]MDB9782593.1 hypothetical protein [Winogradskyella sp.]
MKIKTPLIIIALLFVVSCSSKKHNLTSSNSNDATINNTITDFSQTDGLFKTNNVFEINKQNVLHSVKGNIDKTNYRLINGEPHQSLINVTIKISTLHINENLKSEIGTKSKIVPSRYSIKDEKLFYWWDLDHKVTQDTYDTLKSFGVIKTTDTIDNTNKKPEGVNYYYCSNNLAKFIKLKLNQDIANLNASPIFCN